MSTSRIIRKFERFLFKGIPEHPEPTWERNDNTYVSMRQTGRSQSLFNTTDNDEGAELIGTIVYDSESQLDKFIPVERKD